MTETYEGSDHHGDNIVATYDLWDQILQEPKFRDAITFPAVTLRCSKNHRLATIQLRGRSDPFIDTAPNVVFDVIDGGGSEVRESHPGAEPSAQISDTRTSWTCNQCAAKNPGFNIPMRTRSLLLLYAAAVAGGKKSIKIDGDTLR